MSRKNFPKKEMDRRRMCVIVQPERKGMPMPDLFPGQRPPGWQPPPGTVPTKRNNAGWIVGGVIGFVVLLGVAGGSHPDKTATGPQMPAEDRSALAVATGAAPAAQAPGMPTIDDAAAASLTRTKCAADWPDDLALRAACGRNARAGIASFREIARRYSSVPDMQRALRGCLEQFPDDFALVGGCARNNEEGFKEIGG